MYYRTKSAIIDEKRGSLPKDELVFDWRASAPKLQVDQVAVTNQRNGWGGMRIIPIEMLDKAPAPKWGEFEALLDFYMTGHDVPPNLELGTADRLDDDLNLIAYGGSPGTLTGRVKYDALKQATQARAFLRHTQGGALDGSALLVLCKYNWSDARDAPRIIRFRLCDHEVKEGAGANHSRGWHPARCNKCGLDLTVDSGD
jgi:hypothetical protein